MTLRRQTPNKKTSRQTKASSASSAQKKVKATSKKTPPKSPVPSRVREKSRAKQKSPQQKRPKTLRQPAKIRQTSQQIPVTSGFLPPYQKSPGAAAPGNSLASLIAMARGTIPCDRVIRGGTWLDVFTGTWMTGDIALCEGLIVGVGETYEGREVLDASGLYLVPGFIDAHVHIESSLMTPKRFSEAVLPQGTTTAIWDPHEIANVWGVEGISWALAQSEGLDLCVFVMIPSCVPSTSIEMGLEQSGAHLKAQDLRTFRHHPRVLGLAEMMNFPGLLHGDPDIMAKLEDYRSMLRDGHCPGLGGKDLNAYAVAGIHSCHESTTLDEAREKLSKGIHVLIREGSCAKNATTLLPLLNSRTSTVLGYCSDDRNPLDIAHEGHISRIIDLALRAGHSPEEVFRAASFGAARMYRLLDRGALAPGYLADLVAVRPVDPQGRWTGGIQIEKVFKKGHEIPQNIASVVPQPSSWQPAEAKRKKRTSATGSQSSSPPRKNLRVHVSFEREGLASSLQIIPPRASPLPSHIRVIGVVPQQIVTKNLVYPARYSLENTCVQNLDQDLLKICVVERHHRTKSLGIGLVQGFGLKTGAIATSINHDSHNIIVVGSNDKVIDAAFRQLLAIDGGIVVVSDSDHVESLALPYGGLMSDESPGFIAERLSRLKDLARRCGCVLEEPFLQLSFLALPVIGDLKITDRGLVDVSTMSLVSVFCDSDHAGVL